MSEREETRESEEKSDRPIASHGRQFDYVKIPSSSNFLGRALAVVKSVFLHPLTTTVIVEFDDKVETQKP
jgi:hypothetical protein